MMLRSIASGPTPLSSLRLLLRTFEAKLGLGLVFAVLLIILVGPLVAPYPATAVNVTTANSGPTAGHLLGGDHLGRDVLSRFLLGGKNIIIIPFLSVTFAYVAAALVAIISTYKGGIADVIFGRAIEILQTLPGIFVTLLMVATFGPSTTVLVFAIAIASFPGAARIVRGAVLSQLGLDYIYAAEARGENVVTIAIREIFPNIVDTILADFTLRITWAILGLSTLSFLGLGAQPPHPDWGLMVQEGRGFLQSAPLVLIAPAVALASLSIGLCLIGDALSRLQSGQIGRY